MSAREFIGKIVYYTLRPFIHQFLKDSRRAYVVMEHDGKILVVKNILGSGKWHLPGGGCHKDESFEQGASRELKEEVGVRVPTSRLEVLSPEAFRSKRGFDYQLFLLRMSKSTELKLDRLEILEASWLDPNDLNDSNAGESTLQALTLLGQRTS